MKKSIFEIYFQDTYFDYGSETLVLCPFHNDTNPSASISLEKGLFHCFSCHTSLNEFSFAKKMYNIQNERDFEKLIGLDINTIKSFNSVYPEQDFKKLEQDFKFSKDTIKELNIKTTKEFDFIIPVSMFNTILDERTYKKNSTPKVKSKRNALAGLIIPYDIWTKDKRSTLICAGEKDMIIARSLGFNAICITGGELALPRLGVEEFKDRFITICYDNDMTGRKGANKLGEYLNGIPENIRIADISLLVKEEKEDLFDAVVKYYKDKNDINTMLRESKTFGISDIIKEKKIKYRTVSIKESMLPENRNKYVTSLVQIDGIHDKKFGYNKRFSPIIQTKSSKDIKKELETKIPAEVKDYTITGNNLEDILNLVDAGASIGKINGFIKRKLEYLNAGVEEITSFKKTEPQTAFLASIIDYKSDYSHENGKELPENINLISTNEKLIRGKIYQIVYKVVPHPVKDQQLIAIAKEVVFIDDFHSADELTSGDKEDMKQLQIKKGEDIEKCMEKLYDESCSFVGKGSNRQINEVVALTHHTPLYFTFFGEKIKAVMDNLIIGETRIGKSESAKKWTENIEYGKFVSLGSATVAGMLAGIDKTPNGTFYRLGVLPMNHNKTVIMEELGISNDQALMNHFRDIRSSDMVRISKATGDIEIPSLNRRLWITNQQAKGRPTRSVASYAHGVEIVQGLLPDNPDIARFDIILIVGTDSNYSPKKIERKIPKQVYINRHRWIITRKHNQILWEKDVEDYVLEKAKVLSKKFDCNVQFLGREAYKKLARLSCAVACYILNTENFSDIKITKGIVDWSAKWLDKNYDNYIFRLKEYSAQERKLKESNNEDTKWIENIYKKNGNILLTFLSTAGGTRSKQLQEISGLDLITFNALMSGLVSKYFLQYHNNGIITPTEKFRRTWGDFDKTIDISKNLEHEQNLNNLAIKDDSPF